MRRALYYTVDVQMCSFVFCLAGTAAALRPTPASVLRPQADCVRHMRRIVARNEYNTQYGYDQPDQQYGYDQQGLSNYAQQNSYASQSTREGQASYAPQAQPSYVQALCDFASPEAGQLSFRTGDMIQVVQVSSHGWWEGSLNGQVGSFPSDFCSAPYKEQQQHLRQKYSAQQGHYSSPPQGQGWYDYEQVQAAYVKQSGMHSDGSYAQPEHEVYDPRSATQTYEQWLERSH